MHDEPLREVSMSLLDRILPDPEVVPVAKPQGRIASVLVGDREGFLTRAVDRVVLDHEGMAGDGHRGFTRASGAREPWYQRGTEIRSGRQLSIVSVEDLAEVAGRLGIDSVDPALIGANLLVEGVPRFSYLPAGTRLFLDGGAVVVVEAMNGPCRYAGKALASAHPGREDIELGFVEAAMRRRGVVASVERAGTVSAGSAVQLRVPEQWIWRG